MNGLRETRVRSGDAGDINKLHPQSIAVARGHRHSRHCGELGLPCSSSAPALTTPPHTSEEDGGEFWALSRLPQTDEAAMMRRPNGGVLG